MSDAARGQAPYRFCGDCPWAGRSHARQCPDCGAHFFGGDAQ